MKTLFRCCKRQGKQLYNVDEALDAPLNPPKSLYVSYFLRSHLLLNGLNVIMVQNGLVYSKKNIKNGESLNCVSLFH